MSGRVTPPAPEDPKKLVEGNETRIGIRADAIVDEQPVAVVAEIGKNIFVQLDKAATLGTPMSFAYWLKDVYAVEGLETMFLPPDTVLDAANRWPDDAAPDRNYVTSAEYRTAYNQYKLAPEGGDVKRKFEERITRNLVHRGIPVQAHQMLMSALLAEITITDLLIDRQAAVAPSTAAITKMLFGLSVTFRKRVPLLPGIDLSKLSIMVMNAPSNDFTFTKREVLPVEEIPQQATGFISFGKKPAAGDKLIMGADVWTFVAADGSPQETDIKLGATEEETLLAAVSKLTASKRPDTAKCIYKANIKNMWLDISYKTPGSRGNSFGISTTGAWEGAVSALTLLGGVGKSPAEPEAVTEEPKTASGKQAKGSISFKQNPQADDKFSLGGDEWKFVTSNTPSNSEIKLGTNEAQTLSAVVEKLGNSTRPDTQKCTYAAANITELEITYTTPGGEGDSFAISATPGQGSKWKPDTSGAKLKGGA